MAATPARRDLAGWRQGFISNITNPKVLVLITGLHGARRLLMRRRVRRALDATTGAVLLGFGARLATEHV